MSKIILAILIIIGAIMLTSNQNFSLNKITQSVKESGINSINKSNIYDQNNDINIPDNPEGRNLCNYLNYSFPNLINTIDEGKSCIDFPKFEQDDVCLNYPPSSYGGMTDGSTSDPIITCCEFDGTCQW